MLNYRESDNICCGVRFLSGALKCSCTWTQMLHVGCRLWASPLSCWRTWRDRNWSDAERELDFEGSGWILVNARVKTEASRGGESLWTSLIHGMPNCSKHRHWSYLIIKHSTRLLSECSSKPLGQRGWIDDADNSLGVLMRLALIASAMLAHCAGFPQVQTASRQVSASKYPDKLWILNVNALECLLEQVRIHIQVFDAEQDNAQSRLELCML